MLKTSVSICAALILAAGTFFAPAPAQAQRGVQFGNGGGQVNSARVAGFRGARTSRAGLASRGYAYRGRRGGRSYSGGYGGSYYGGGWGYYGDGFAAGAILGGLLAAPYYGGDYYDGYGYAYVPAPGYATPRRYYFNPTNAQKCGQSPGSANYVPCN